MSRVPDVDCAIVGAGPAGSVLAALLASRGRSVAIVDRDRFPRDKICGEFLSWDAHPVVEMVGAMEEIDDAGAPRIERCRIVGTRRVYEMAFPHAAIGVSRMLLDDVLFRCAGRSGAVRYDGWSVTRLDSDGPRITMERDGERHELSARLLVGAWGRWGRFDAQLGRPFVQDRRHRHFGFKRHYLRAEGRGPRAEGGRKSAERGGESAERCARSAERGGHSAERGGESGAGSQSSFGRTAAGDQITIDLHSFDGGYLGVNAIEGGLSNLCGLVHARRIASLRGGWDAFVDQIRAERPRLEELYSRHEPAQESFLSSEPVIFRARSAVERGIFLIGDASGIVDPLAGNGMAMAMQSALLAAPYLLRLLDAPADRSSLERAYLDAHAAFFQPRIRWSRAAAHLLSRPALLDVALAGVRGPRAGAFFLNRTRTSREEVLRLAERWDASHRPHTRRA